MTRKYARELAEKVTLEELKQMFLNAKENIKNWEQISRVNKSMTKGTAMNILSANFDQYKSEKDIHIMGKINMIREFGTFLPGYTPQSKKEIKHGYVHHEDPTFNGFTL